MTDQHSFKQMPAVELNQWMEEKKEFFLIDTLTNDHYQKVHLPDSLNACVFEVVFVSKVKELVKDKNAEIVLYGSSSRSRDAITAAEKLNQEGYTRLNILQGGIEAWRKAGFAVEGEAVDAPGDPQTILKLEDRTYRINAEQSHIEWTGRNPNTSHFGRVRIAGGELTSNNGVFSGVIDIDMESITNINLEGDEMQPILVAHLKSDDFFLTKLFPTARYKIISAKPVHEPFLTVPNYEIEGSLELRGVEARQDFTATVAGISENVISAEAHFDIDKTRWNILYGSSRFFEFLGMHLVFDLISIQVRIVAS